MSLQTKTLDPIEHGTIKGYRQHRYRKVGIPTNDGCGCRAAYNASKRERAAAQAPRSAHEWNRGLTGERPVIATRPLSARCPTEGCGEDGTDPRVGGDGWVFIRVVGSAMCGRWYCSGPCATVGIALAELRPATASTGGDL
ncbi:hypothetical protein ACFWP2_20540 [Kitasatospora sp. NPDC058444]|uniref:hypothetical protein n=1 Tax=Kitasatospora sp. NPDC058444 TaxID=3346504 RepID=UPI0036535626